MLPISPNGSLLHPYRTFPFLIYLQLSLSCSTRLKTCRERLSQSSPILIGGICRHPSNVSMQKKFWRLSAILQCLWSLFLNGYRGWQTPHPPSLFNWYHRKPLAARKIWSSAWFRPLQIVRCESLKWSVIVRWWELCWRSICIRRRTVKPLSFTNSFPRQDHSRHEWQWERLVKWVSGNQGHRKEPHFNWMCTPTSFEVVTLTFSVRRSWSSEREGTEGDSVLYEWTSLRVVCSWWKSPGRSRLRKLECLVSQRRSLRTCGKMKRKFDFSFFRSDSRFCIAEAAEHTTISWLASHPTPVCWWACVQPLWTDGWGFAFRYQLYFWKIGTFILNQNLFMKPENGLSLAGTSLKGMLCHWCSLLLPDQWQLCWKLSLWDLLGE